MKPPLNLVNKNDFLVNIFDHLNFIIREDELKEKIYLNCRVSKKVIATISSFLHL